MDFTKYVDLLERSGLYFSRADQFQDPFEGSLSHRNVELRPFIYEGSGIPEHVFQMRAEIIEWSRQWTFINCWHMNQYESAAMWKLYAESKKAIAIQSTYERLRAVLSNDVLIGMVQYIDYDKDWLREDDLRHQFMHKRKSFEHERELRAFIQDLPVAEKGGINIGRVNPDLGRSIGVELETLVERVVIAPVSPGWFRDLVNRITTKYKMHWPVDGSTLDQKPIY